MIEEAFDRCQSQFDERVTKHMAGPGRCSEARVRQYVTSIQNTEKRWRTFSLLKCCGFMPCQRTLFSCLCVKTKVSDLKLLEDYDNEEAWKSAVNKRKFLFDRILKEYDPPELSGPEYDDVDTQTEKQQQAVSKENNDQVGGGNGGSSKLNVNLVSPWEQVSSREKDELLHKGRKRGASGFTPKDEAEIEKLKKPRSTWVPLTVIQKV